MKKIKSATLTLMPENIVNDYSNENPGESVQISGPLTQISKNNVEQLWIDSSKTTFIKDYDRSSRKKTNLFLLNIAAALDGCDDQLLPASFRALEAELKFRPSLLGKITLVQTLMLSISCPFWGYMADQYSRKLIIACGIFCWGVTTVLLAFTYNVISIFILRGINGLFLGSIGPISQGVLADLTVDVERGLQFGIMQMCASGGRVIGNVVTTSVAFLHVGGLSGWRWTFLGVGVFSIIFGLIIALLPTSFSSSSSCPSKNDINQQVIDDKQPLVPDLQTNRQDSLYNVIIPHTQPIDRFFNDLWSQSLTRPSGIIGVIPWSAFAFLTMFMQYIGMGDVKASIVAGSLLFGAMIAGPLGGILGDKAHSYSPSHGRPFMAQLSMIIRIPLLTLAFLYIPLEPKSFWKFLIIFFIIGLASFAGVVVGRPLLSDVVQPRHRATTFGLVVALEGIFGSLLGAPLVGYLVEYQFGYIHSDLHVDDMPADIAKMNSIALSRALACVSILPWIISLFLYGFIHLTYGKDSKYAKDLENSNNLASN